VDQSLVRFLMVDYGWPGCVHYIATMGYVRHIVAFGNV
jgi:hypothetical protein